MIARVTIITAKGDLGLRELRQIGAAVDALMADKRQKIVIECSAADSIEPLAIGALLAIAERIVEHGGALKFARTGRFLRAALNRYGAEFFEHYASIEEAIMSFDEEWNGDETNH